MITIILIKFCTIHIQEEGILVIQERDGKVKPKQASLHAKVKEIIRKAVHKKCFCNAVTPRNLNLDRATLYICN